MSNQNLPGPYWQDQDDAGYRRGSDPNGRSRRMSRRDDGDFWRGEGSGADRGERARPSGGSRHSAGNGWLTAGRQGTAGRRSTGQRASQPGGPRRSRVRDYVTDGRGWPALFSQTADELRRRFGSRGSAAVGGTRRPSGQAGEDFWEGPDRSGSSRDGAPTGNGTSASPLSSALRRSQNGYRGTRQPADGYRDYGGSRSAVREPDFWPGEDAGTRSLRTRIAERTGVGRGPGGGGGRGGGGRRGGGRRDWDYGGRGRPRTRGERFKYWLLYGRWWRHWTWKKAVAVFFGGIAGIILLMFIAVAIMYETTPIPTAETALLKGVSSTVYFPNGKLLGTFTNNGFTHEVLTEQQIPKIMDEAIVASEDRHFYSEGGISLTGTIRAGLNDLFGHGNLQGASTITEQYVKNYYQSLSSIASSQSITYKLKEIFAAVKIAHVRSKPWILTQYLNTAPFGPQTYGVGAAALQYFNINLSKPGATLTLPQAAMLAAIPNSPDGQSPYPNAGQAYINLVYRWQYVLHYMAVDGAISTQQANALCANCSLAQAEKAFAKNVKVIPPGSNSGESGVDGYLMEMVQRELEAPKSFGGYGLTNRQVLTGGYKITTTFNMRLINALSHSVKWGQGQIAALSGSPMPGYDWIGSVLEDVKTGAIAAVDGGPGYYVKNCTKTTVSCFDNRAEYPEEVGSSSKPYVLSTAVSEGMNVFTSTLNGSEPLAIPYAPEGSSQSEINSTMNMLSRLSAPPGHNLKVDNSVFTYNNVWYKVFNEAGENYGPLPVNAATAVSSDAAYEDLSHRVGIDNIINMAARFGVGQNPFNATCPIGGNAKAMRACSTLTGRDGLEAMFSTNPKLCNSSLNFCGSPQITYGAAPLTPVDQASTFATLADGGVYHTPHVVAAVQQGASVLRSPVQTREVLTPAQAADVDWALSFDNNFAGATAEGTVTFRPGGIIAKTGTLGTGASANTAWFIGAIPKKYALSVALYTQLAGGTAEILDNLPPVGGQSSGAFGGAWPATIWNHFMTTEFGNQSWVPVGQVFHTVNGYPFTRWVQVAPHKAKPKKQTCQSRGHKSGGQNCQSSCPPHSQQCGGNPSPNPTTSTCLPFGPPCSTTNPSPSPTQPAPTPTPTPTLTTAGASTQAAEEVSPALMLLPQRGG